MVLWHCLVVVQSYSWQQLYTGLVILFVVRMVPSYDLNADYFFVFALRLSRMLEETIRRSEDPPSNVLKSWQIIAQFFHLLFIRMWSSCSTVPLAWLNIYSFVILYWRLCIQYYIIKGFESNSISVVELIRCKFVYITDTKLSINIRSNSQDVMVCYLSDKREKPLIKMCQLFIVERVCCWIIWDNTYCMVDFVANYNASEFNFSNFHGRFMS